MSSIAVVLAAGVGTRFGADLPKQYNKINGKMVISYVIEALKKTKINEIIVVCGNEYYAQRVANWFGIKTIVGGKARNISVKNALDYIYQNTKHEKVVFCDSARPNLDPEFVDDCIDKLDEYDSVITAQHITDSLGHNNKINLNREDYFLIQTPECFKLSVLKNFDVKSETTAIVQQLGDDKKVYCNFGLKNNIKITYKDDLEIASILLKEPK